MAAIKIFHIFDGWQKLAPIIVIIILKLSNLLVTFFPGDSRHNRIKFLELSLTDIGVPINECFIFLIEGFLIEDELIVGEVEGKVGVGLLF